VCHGNLGCDSIEDWITRIYSWAASGAITIHSVECIDIWRVALVDVDEPVRHHANNSDVEGAQPGKVERQSDVRVGVDRVVQNGQTDDPSKTCNRAKGRASACRRGRHSRHCGRLDVKAGT
jgi:hypothetical protein